MHRNLLLELLAEYAARFPTEDVDPFRRFVGRQPRCFERDCFDDGHVTGSAWIVSADRGRTLLTHHAKLDKWLQPGGHSDGDADPLAVALREGAEETGLVLEPVSKLVLDIDVHAIPARGSEPRHLHYDVRFALAVVGSEDFVVSEESVDLAWVEPADLGRFTAEESVLRMARKFHAWSRELRPTSTGASK